MWNDINDLSDAVCASSVPGTKLVNSTQHRELCRQDDSLDFLRHFSHDHQYSVYLTLNGILNIDPGDEFESSMDWDEQLRKSYIFKVSCTLWLLRVGPKGLAGMYDAGMTLGTYLSDQECEELHGADVIKVNCLMWFARRLEFWGRGVKAGHFLPAVNANFINEVNYEPQTDGFF